MLEYRIYPVTRQGRVLGPSTVVHCAANEDALRQAERAIDRYDVEVWQEERFVARLSHEHSRPE